MQVPTLYPVAAAIATLLSLHGLRKGSLSPSGAIAAWLVGYAHLANPIKVFGVALIFFYLAGSRATKVKAEVKATLEDGPDPGKSSGNRNAIQVVSNSLPSLLAALTFRFASSTELEITTRCVISDPTSKRLIYLALGQLATNFADTLASEVGILSPTPPRHILTLRQVPPGTNGAVSPLGLLASLLGGLVMAGVFIVDLYLESKPCARGGGWVGEMLVFGTLAGVGGSMLDTVLGATVQETRYSSADKRVLTDHSRRPRGEAGVGRIGFGRDILSNSGVNFVSGCAMAGLGWWWAR